MWTGPSKFINVEHETAVVQFPHGRRIFLATHVKPWTQSFMNPIPALQDSFTDDATGPDPTITEDSTPDILETAYHEGNDKLSAVEDETHPK